MKLKNGAFDKIILIAALPVLIFIAPYLKEYSMIFKKNTSCYAPCYINGSIPCFDWRALKPTPSSLSLIKIENKVGGGFLFLLLVLGYLV